MLTIWNGFMTQPETTIHLLASCPALANTRKNTTEPIVLQLRKLHNPTPSSDEEFAMFLLGTYTMTDAKTAVMAS